MSTIYLSSNLNTSIQESIQSLKAELEFSRAQQRRYILQLSTLQAVRAKVSASLEELAGSYKKEVKSFELKVKKLETQVKQLRKKNSLYEMEIQNFERRILEKDQIISSILAKDFGVGLKSGVQLGKREETMVFPSDNKQTEQLSTVDQRRFEIPKPKSTAPVEAENTITQNPKTIQTTFAKKLQKVHKNQEMEPVQIKEGNLEFVKSQSFNESIQKKDHKRKDQHESQVIESYGQFEEGDHVQVVKESQMQTEKEGSNDQEIIKSFGESDHQVFKGFQQHQFNQEQFNRPNLAQNSLQSRRQTSEDSSSKIENFINKVEENTVVEFGQQNQSNFMNFSGMENELKPVEESSPKFNEEVEEQAEVFVVPMKRNVPPPPAVKKPPVPPKISGKRSLKPKHIPKYKESSIFQDEKHQNHDFLLQTNPPVILTSEEISGTMQPEKFVSELTSNQNYRPKIELGGENELDQHQVAGENQGVTTLQQPFFEQEQEQRNDLELEITHEKQNTSYSSVNKSKKGKRQQARPVQHQLIDFEAETLPIQETQGSSLNFFERLAGNDTEEHLQTASPSFIPHFEGTPEDHEMHGLVDESSIDQIEDTSMISNTIFPEESEFGGERMGHQETKRRKGSTDQEKSTISGERKETQKTVFSPVPMKKMAKKKAKRQTVEVMDPSSFL